MLTKMASRWFILIIKRCIDGSKFSKDASRLRCFNSYYVMESTSTAIGDNDIVSLQNDEDRYATYKDSTEWHTLLTCSRFLVSYRLLSRWQNQLEYFLYQFCKTHAPQILVDCHWSCPEAAELTQLTEKFTEFFCFHNKPVFRNHGVSEEERESFCTKLQRVRRIRNFAVHRVNPSVYTIRKYANDALDVLRIVQRLGNEAFRRSFESPVSLKLICLAKVSMDD